MWTDDPLFHPRGTKKPQYNILRPKIAWQKLGIRHSLFYANYVQQPGGDQFVPGTKIHRLRPVRLGERAVGFIEVELDALIEGLREQRDAEFTKGRRGKRNHGQFIKL